MTPTDLRGYMEVISRSKELAVIKRKVSAKYEIAAITS